MVLLVSLVSAPFGWSYDQVVLVPVFIQVSLWVIAARQIHVKAILFAAYMGITVITLTIDARALGELYYWWLAPSFLAVYLLSKKTLNAGTIPIKKELNLSPP
jgi:hypothetical protein